MSLSECFLCDIMSFIKMKCHREEKQKKRLSNFTANQVFINNLICIARLFLFFSFQVRNEKNPIKHKKRMKRRNRREKKVQILFSLFFKCINKNKSLIELGNPLSVSFICSPDK